MEAARPHPEETKRLDALRASNLLDTEVEARFDRLTDLLATALQVPIALVSLVDDHRQWFKSCHGLGVRETPRNLAFCAHAIITETEPFVVPDTSLDPRFVDNPLVTSYPKIRFYAGRVVRAEDGSPLGTLCAIDQRPRQLTDIELIVLDQIADLVESEIQRSAHDRVITGQLMSDHRQATILDTVREGFMLHDDSGRILEWNRAAERLLGLRRDQLRGHRINDTTWNAVRLDGSAYPVEERPTMRALRTGSTVAEDTYGVLHSSGRRLWLRVSARPVSDADGVTTGVVTSFMDVTVEIDEARRRRELEAELERRERTARICLDALEQGVILGGPDGAIPLLNPAAETILGYSAAELTANWQSDEWRTWDEDGEVLEGTDRPILRALTTGEPVVGQIIGWRRKDGERVLLRLSCVPNVDGDRSVVLAFTEVTAEYRARKLLDTVLEVAPVGLAVMDDEGRFVRTNQVFAAQLGCGPEELNGRAAVDLVYPDDQDIAADVSAALYAGTDQPISFEHRVVTSDGTERWVSTAIAVAEIAEGHLSVAASSDVTERRNMLQELSRYGHLFRNANDLIVVLDDQGRVALASPSSERMFGPITGRPITDVVHPDDRQTVVEAIGPDAAVDDSERVTVRVHDARGDVVHVECVGMNLLDNPAVRGIVVTGRDVTARIAATSAIEYQATRDPLTGLANRHHLQTVVERTLAERADDEAIGVLFVDLDDFKRINDEFGHAAGDAVITQVATLLEDITRSDDVVARVGGDEFVVFLPAVGSAEQALAIAARFRDRLLTLPHTYGPLSASIGVTTVELGDTFSTLIDRADVAMYRAKANVSSAIELAEGDLFVRATTPQHVMIS